MTWAMIASWAVIIAAVSVTAFLLARWVDYLCDDDRGDR